jgi:hypothetical protein
MEKINHEYYAKKAIGYLIDHIVNFKTGNKYISYGELARAIDYPEPHTGSFFGFNIGHTLGLLGHLIENIPIEDWEGRIPYLQSMIVRQDTKLPSDGIREFYPNYPNLEKEKKKDFVKLEYEKIFQFGERWYIVLNQLGINKGEYKAKNANRYNPFGSEGSPEHTGLRDYISCNPDYIGLDFNSGITEYPLKSGDSIDVFFESEDNMIGVEVKSIRSGNDDLERGIFQCVKYREVKTAENKVNNKHSAVDCILVYEGEMDNTNLKYAKILDVQIIRVEYNKWRK